MTGLECRAVVELVSDYLDQDLDPERHSGVVAHLVGCVGCERYVDQLRQTVRLVGRLPWPVVATQSPPLMVRGDGIDDHG